MTVLYSDIQAAYRILIYRKKLRCLNQYLRPLFKKTSSYILKY